MANRRCFLFLTVGLACVAAPGGLAPSASASFFEEPGVIELSAVPPEYESSGDIPPAGGSVEGPRHAVEAVEQDGDSTPNPDGTVSPDPWASWFSASAEAQRRPAPRADRLPDYPIVMNREVQHFLDRFTGIRRAVVDRWVNRSGRYLDMIREALKEHGLPEDLAFTAMVESGFDPRAVSRAGAKGLWQFMAATARRYGLRVDSWVDERLDPEKSTLAAVAYLRDLYRQFGSWKLAQAAYNAGEVTVARAVRATGSSDFWTLAQSRHLRRETKNFVPAIQAATMIGRDPTRYGFEVGQHVQSPVEVVRVPPRTDLHRLARQARVPIERLRDLNPVLVKGTTPPDRAWDLRVPAGSEERVLAALAPPKPKVVARKGGTRPVSGGGIHVVRPHETVSGIAKRYGVSVADVLRWNRLAPDQLIRPGDRLLVADLGPAVATASQGGFR
jgi:membrane-bound lytic murein transglycosylase D